MEAWISSKVRPLVSGTNRSTNTTVSPQMLAKMKNVPASSLKFYISEKLQGKQTVAITMYADAATAIQRVAFCLQPFVNLP